MSYSQLNSSFLLYSELLSLNINCLRKELLLLKEDHRAPKLISVSHIIVETLHESIFNSLITKCYEMLGEQFGRMKTLIPSHH